MADDTVPSGASTAMSDLIGRSRRLLPLAHARQILFGFNTRNALAFGGLVTRVSVREAACTDYFLTGRPPQSAIKEGGRMSQTSGTASPCQLTFSLLACPQRARW
jgi:hypothetical protein